MTGPNSGLAVVTGAAGGMGRATAKRFAADGYDLLLADVAEAPLAALADELKGQGAKVDILVGDVAAADYPAQLIAAIGARPLRAVVHTAGLSPSMAGPERILAVNIGAMVRLVDALLARAVTGTAVVLIASTAGHMGAPPELDVALQGSAPQTWADLLAPYAPTPEAAYALSKRAVLRLARRAAAAWGAKGARIVTLSPGIIDTGMGRAELAVQPLMAGMIEHSPLPRMGLASEIASVAAFLCSADASFVTGTDVLVDGGSIGATNA
jgi:NAD(P)-dependent dehydrogenase (short-subunit alcohol dehydrogenase family)